VIANSVMSLIGAVPRPSAVAVSSTAERASPARSQSIGSSCSVKTIA
jgi:hypothetical protein